jgi:hypothetical protein
MFELRVCLLGRHSYHSSHTSSPFFFSSFFRWSFTFLFVQAGLRPRSFYLLQSWDCSMHNACGLFVEIMSCRLFCLARPLTATFQISVFWVAGIIGVSHCCPLAVLFVNSSAHCCFLVLGFEFRALCLPLHPAPSTYWISMCILLFGCLCSVSCGEAHILVLIGKCVFLWPNKGFIKLC